MARPTKYTQEIAEGVAGMIAKGYTIRDAAKAFGVSEASISRWRAEHIDFNQSIASATDRQYYGAKKLKQAGIRTYRRKGCTIIPSNPALKIGSLESSITTAKNSVSSNIARWHGLPIRPRPLEYTPTQPYFDPNTERVEWIDRRGVLHTCAAETWRTTHQPQYQPFIADFF